MPQINITVRNKIASADKSVVYVCGNSDYVLKFDFDSEWNAYTSKTARISYGESYTDVVFSGNECAVPVLKDIYNFKVGVYAGNLHTTTPAFVYAKKSILCEGGTPEDPSPSVYAQLMTALNGKANSNHTHSYNDLTNKPDIPEAYDDTEVKQMIQGKAAANHTHSYNSLTDKPVIPTVDSNSIKAALGIDVVQAIDNVEEQIDALDEGKADYDHVHTWDEIQEKPEIPEAYDDTEIKADIVTVKNDITSLQAGKQDTIRDLETIRSGASAGATALQTVPLATNGGIKRNADGTYAIDRAGTVVIDNRSSWTAAATMPIVANMTDYAVKRAMTDGVGAAWTDAEKQAACQRMGAEQAKCEWVLKGTLSGTADDRGNIDTGVTVDMTGCSEFTIFGKIIVSSSVASLKANNNWWLIYGAATTSYPFVYARYLTNGLGGYDCIISAQSAAYGQYGTRSNGYTTTDHMIDTITQIGLSSTSNVTSCDIKIYAR